MERLDFDPDITRRDDAPYWAAAMVLAIKARNQKRIIEARKQLQRLGYTIIAARATERQEVAHVN